MEGDSLTKTAQLASASSIATEKTSVISLEIVVERTHSMTMLLVHCDIRSPGMSMQDKNRLQQ